MYVINKISFWTSINFFLLKLKKTCCIWKLNSLKTRFTIKHGFQFDKIKETVLKLKVKTNFFQTRVSSFRQSLQSRLRRHRSPGLLHCHRPEARHSLQLPSAGMKSVIIQLYASKNTYITINLLLNQMYFDFKLRSF